MYCPSCGTEVTQELSYCSRCGANLKPLVGQAGLPPSKLVGAAWAISIAVTVVTLGGFGMIFGVVMTLIDRGIGLSPAGMILVFFAMLFILAVAAMLVRQLSRVLSIPQLSSKAEPVEKPNLVEKPVQQITAARAPGSSVTDHTTRTFDPIYKERNTQR